jgi:hypothetical protein
MIVDYAPVAAQLSDQRVAAIADSVGFRALRVTIQTVFPFSHIEILHELK